MDSSGRGDGGRGSGASEGRPPVALRLLARLDSWIGGFEAALLVALLLGLAAGAVGQIVTQNAGPRVEAAARTGLRVAGFGLVLVGVGFAVVGRRRADPRLSRRSEKGLLAGAFFLLVAGALSISSVLDYLLRAAVLWIGLLGASLATRRRRHITIEVLEKFLPPRWKRVSAGATSLGALGLLAVLFAVSVEYVAESRARAEVFFVHLETGTSFPAWWVKVALPLGLGLMAWRFALLACEAFLGVDLLPRPSAEAEVQAAGEALAP